MDEAWKSLIQVAPWGFVIIVLRWLDIQDDKEKRKERDDNAKEKAEKDRESTQFIAKTYADAINALAKSVADQNAVIIDTKNTVVKSYENLGITQDLIAIAKEYTKMQGKSSAAD